METITISFSQDRYFTVAQDGRACTHLGWDEMVGQIINLTRRVVGERIYPMLTPEEDAERERRWVRPVESECDDWSSIELHIPFNRSHR